MVEVAIAVMVLLIAIAGTLAFNNYASAEIHRCRVQTDATMLGTMLMEAWRGQGGKANFNPVTELSAAILDSDDVDVLYAWLGPGIPSNFTLAFSSHPFYIIKANNTNYRISLSYRTISGRKFLNVRVGYPDSIDKTYWQSNNYVGITRSVN